MNRGLKEWKSVSDDTVGLSALIADEILKHSKTVDKKYGFYKNIPLKVGKFLYNTDGFLGKIDNLEVRYTIYFCRDQRDYEFLTNYGKLNCTADYPEEYIQITTAYIGNQLQYDFIDDVNHEINHLLQYGNGATKNEGLYDRVVSVARDMSISAIGRSAAYLMYCTFRHEEDSFTVQFYSFLQRNFPDVTSIIGDDGFDKCVKGFQVYSNIEKCYKMSVDNLNSESVKKALNDMGLTQNQWKIRVEKGIKRLERKLHHAYERHCIERMNGSTTENLIKKNINIYEQYGDIKQIIEPEYDF